MKKIILILLMSIQAFAWFGLELPEEKVTLNGYDVKIVNSDRKDSFFFGDSFRIYQREDNYKKEMENRIISVFNLVNRYGKDKGYKSFIIENEEFKIGQTGLNSGEDIAKYCTLGTTYEVPTRYTQYANYCGYGKQPLILGLAKISVYVIYLKDSSGTFQIQ